MASSPKRLGALAFTTALLVGACSSSGGSSPSASAAAPSVTAPSAAASVAAPSAAASSAASAAASQGATPSNAATCTAGSITAGGSTALQPVVEKAANDYKGLCPGSTISVQGGGSGTGLTQVAAGTFNIGNSDVTAEEKLDATAAATLVNHNIAVQGWVMVNNPGVTGVTNLTTQQAVDIWTGKITNWNQIPGGPSQEIVLILRPASSGTRATFKKIVLGGKDEASGQALTEDSNGAVTQAVKSTPGGTSVIGFAYYQANKAGLTGLQLDGIDPTVDNMTNGTYKLQAVGHAYTKGTPSGLTDSFIQYLLSPYVQQVTLPSLYYAPAPAQ
jgi:phosphate transport system substrate-binding protein